MLPTRDPSQGKDTYKLKVREWKKRYFMLMEMTGKQESQYSYKTKQALKQRPQEFPSQL